MINVTHPIYPPQTIEEKWYDKFIAHGWTVDGDYVPPAKPVSDPAGTEPKKRGPKPKAK